MDPEKTEVSTAMAKKQGASSSKSELQINASTRLQRNQAEKQRRDRLNGYVTELATLVPMVKDASKPLDKVSILRLTAAHMRLNLSCLNPKRFKSEVPILPASVLSYLELLEKSLGGFVLVTTFTGLVVFCSKAIENFTGYHNIDVIGQPVFNYVHNKEVSFFERKINSIASQYKKKHIKNVSKVIKVHMRQRPLPRTTDSKYQKMTIKLSIHSNENHSSEGKEPKPNDKKKKMACKDFGASAVILMFIQPTIEPKINLLLVTQDVYYTIHGLQGEIMFADQRISPITGYLPSEVRGTNAYQYIFDSDVPIALFAQKAMFSSNDGIGLITYRLRIFGSKFIYLQSKGQIVYKDSSTEISHFVCYNRCLSDEEGSKELRKFQERFAPQIDKKKNTPVKAIEDCESTYTKTSVPEVSTHLNGLSSSASSYSPHKSSNSLSPKAFEKNKMTRVKKKVGSTESLPALEKQNLCLEPSKSNKMSSNTKQLHFNSSGGSFQSMELTKDTATMEYFNNCENKTGNHQAVEGFILPTFSTKEKVSLQNIADFSLICSDKPGDVSFAQKSDSSFCNSHSSIHTECLDTVTSPVNIQDSSDNMDLGKSILVNSNGILLNNGMYNSASHSAEDYNQIIQQVEVSKLCDENTPFSYSNEGDKFNFSYAQEPGTLTGPIRCTVQNESSPLNPASIPSSYDFNVASISLFSMDHETAAINKTANYSVLNEPITNGFGNDYSELRNEDCHLPSIQNNAYLNEQSYQPADNLLKGYQNSLEGISLNSSFSNSLNHFDSKLGFRNQDVQELSKPNIQPKRSIFSEHLDIECTPCLNAEYPAPSSYPSKRKKIMNGHKLYDAKDKTNNSKLLLKVFESHLRNNDALDVFAGKQHEQNDIFNQCQMELPFVKNTSQYKETSDINFNGELYNELDVILAELPPSACSPNDYPLEIPQLQDWNINEHTNSQFVPSEPFMNSMSEQVDFTLLS